MGDELTMSYCPGGALAHTCRPTALATAFLSLLHKGFAGPRPAGSLQCKLCVSLPERPTMTMRVREEDLNNYLGVLEFVEDCAVMAKKMCKMIGLALDAMGASGFASTALEIADYFFETMKWLIQAALFAGRATITKKDLAVSARAVCRQRLRNLPMPRSAQPHLLRNPPLRHLSARHVALNRARSTLSSATSSATLRSPTAPGKRRCSGARSASGSATTAVRAS